MSNDVAETTERGPVITISVDETVGGKRVERSWVRFADEWTKLPPTAQGHFLSEIVRGLSAEVQGDADRLRGVPGRDHLASVKAGHRAAAALDSRRPARTLSARELLSALAAAQAGVEADDQVRQSVREMLQVLTKAAMADLEQLEGLGDDT